MKLSDAYEKKVDNPELELVCKVYNINFGKNKDILDRCQILREYMTFVDYVRFYHKEQNFEDLCIAINRAIDRCINEGVLEDFLQKNRAEVIKVTQLDYTFDRQVMLEREDAREEERELVALKMIRSNKPVEEIVEFTNLSREEVLKLYEKNEIFD